MDLKEKARELDEHIKEIKEADIIVGIPSYNNARTIENVVTAVQAGLAKYFRDLKAVIVNADGGSTDGTREAVHNVQLEKYKSILLFHIEKPPLTISTPYHGIPGKGSAFRAIFETAAALKAKACAVVDSDLRSITPEWIELLLKPIISGEFDYVAPLYLRHKYDGTITNSIVYPLSRALYGKRIRQPIGGEFGFSGALAEFYLTKDVWETDVARFGIDIWMTTTALANKFRVCQAYLGAKIHDPKDPGADLSAMLYQVVGSTCDLMDTYPDVWKSIKGSEPVPTFGFRYAVGLEPVSVNVERMIEKFRLGVDELSKVWADVLPQNIMEFLSAAKELPKEDFRVPGDIWARIIYSFAIAAHRKTLNREHLLKSLTPLYLGRTASFIMSVENSDAMEVEDEIEGLCLSFEEEKSFLIETWDAS
jgi:glycosyltransferase involved in cell wall biosynthesis